MHCCPVNRTAVCAPYGPCRRCVRCLISTGARHVTRMNGERCKCYVRLFVCLPRGTICTHGYMVRHGAVPVPAFRKDAAQRAVRHPLAHPGSWSWTTSRASSWSGVWDDFSLPDDVLASIPLP